MILISISAIRSIISPYMVVTSNYLLLSCPVVLISGKYLNRSCYFHFQLHIFTLGLIECSFA